MPRRVLLAMFMMTPAALGAETGSTLRPGVAYHYVKSNLDGSDPWQVTTYVSSPMRLDVLKWGPGRGEIVEVTADLDRTGCVSQHFEQWNLRDGVMALSMWADLSEDGWTLSFHREGSPAIALRGSGRPLHPYGFDMQAMNVSPGCLSRTKPPVIGLNGFNPVPGATPPLVDYGPIRVESLGDEQLAGKDFSVLTWFSREDGRTVRAESARPDSDDWTSFRLERKGTERMDPFQWQAFRGSVLGRFVVTPSSPARNSGGADAGPR
ncbi:MAG TPA: hypothetical protein VFF12_19165 [Myxococcaceae bacterium]|nr:hypothetical protein [Myxococcaceae bacterium]